MEAVELQLIINAIDNASKNIGGVSKSLDLFSKAAKGGKDFAAGLGVNLNALSNPAMAAGQGIKALADYVKGAMDDTQAYTQSIKEMSMSFGAAPEEISRLIQAGDDMGVSMDEMHQAMLRMTQNGMAPTIDSLAMLADRTNQILDPTKRADELVKLLGRSWTKLDPLLRQGGDSIRALAASQNDALVVTQAEIDKSEALRVQQDKLNDANTRLSYTVGSVMIPIMTNATLNWAAAAEGALDLAEAIVKAHKSILDNAVAMGTLRNRDIDAAEAVKANTAAIKLGTDALGDRYDSMRAVTWAGEDLVAVGNYERDMFIQLNDVTEYNATKTKLAAAEQEKLNKQMKAVALGVSGGLLNAYNSYWATMGDLTKRADELYTRMENLRKTGRGNTEEALALKQEYDGLIPAMDAATAALERTTAEMIYQQAVEGMAPEAALEFARALGLISESDYNLATAINTVKEKHEAGLISEELYTKGMLLLYDAAKDGVLTLEEVKKAMDLLDGMVANATVNINASYPNGIPYIPAGYGYGGSGAPQSGPPPSSEVPGAGGTPGGPPGSYGSNSTGYNIFGGVNIYAAPGQNGAQLYDEFAREARKRANSGAAQAGRL